MPFPKTLIHPHYKKGTTTAVPGVDTTTGRKFTDYQGTADRFPPVIVTTDDQEAQHRAQGYVADGESVGGAAYQRYPMWMKKAGEADMLASSPTDEQALTEMGFAAPGIPDPEAAQTSASSPHVPGRTVVEFPKMVDGRVVDPGRSDGFQEYPKWVGDVLVNSRQEEEALKPRAAKPKKIA